jgi:hypothetical protein
MHARSWCLLAVRPCRYGDIVPQNTVERLFAMVVELAGGVVLGVILAIVSQVVDAYAAKARHFATQMNTVRPYDRVRGWGGERARFPLFAAVAALSTACAHAYDRHHPLLRPPLPNPPPGSSVHGVVCPVGAGTGVHGEPLPAQALAAEDSALLQQLPPVGMGTPGGRGPATLVPTPSPAPSSICTHSPHPTLGN